RKARAGIARRIVSEPRLARAVSVHHVDFIVTITIAVKHNAAAVGREFRTNIVDVSEIVSKTRLAAAVRIHYIDIRVTAIDTVAEGPKHNAAAVWRETRQEIAGRIVSEPGLSATVCVHRIDLKVVVATAGKHDATVGRTA